MEELYHVAVTLSIVLPCYNEEANIAASVRDVLLWLRKAKIKGEVIVVDDGSKDGSLRVLTAMRKRAKNMHIVRHTRNQGYGIAIRSGCDAAKGEVIAFMDSDRQFHAKDLGVLLPHMKDYAFVSGRRRKRADPLVRRLFGKMLATMNLVMLGLWVRDINCGMKMFRRGIWKKIRPVHGVEKLFNTEIFLKLKQRKIPWLQVLISHYPRRAGSPTGGSPRVILRMFTELRNLKRGARA